MKRKTNAAQRVREQKGVTRIVIDSENQNKGHGWWDSLGENGRAVASRLMLGFGIMGVGGIIAYFVVRKAKKERARHEQAKSFGKDIYATWAKQLKMAFDNDEWWGTDVPMVRYIIKKIPSKDDFDLVEKSYKKQYHRELIPDMADELTKLEYDDMLTILKAKPQTLKDGQKPPKIYDPEGWARRFHNALDYTWLGFMTGTDEDAIRVLFQEIPTQKAFWATAHAYYRMYSVHLWDDLDGDLDWTIDWRALLKKKPKQ